MISYQIYRNGKWFHCGEDHATWHNFRGPRRQISLTPAALADLLAIIARWP